MRTLAIDTSHAAGSVAACAGERLAVRPLGAAGEHAGLLAERLTEVARELGWSLAEAQLVAVIRGPGSFTGLRVGVASAKAIAWAGRLKLVGISGFEAVAHETARVAGWHPRPLEIAFDAGRSEVYAARLIPDGASPTGWRAGPAALHAANAWIAALPAGSSVSGPALQLHATSVAAAGHQPAPAAGWFPTAEAAAALGRALAAAGISDDPHTLVPEYLRPSYADERRAAPAPHDPA
jgi:tRNA threonylcarbamoyladenosine biosynthesis protein TsaB